MVFILSLRIRNDPADVIESVQAYGGNANQMQGARDIQNKRFSSNGASDIICNADMRVEKIRQFCRLQACPEFIEGTWVTV